MYFFDEHKQERMENSSSSYEEAREPPGLPTTSTRGYEEEMTTRRADHANWRKETSQHRGTFFGYKSAPKTSPDVKQQVDVVPQTNNVAMGLMSRYASRDQEQRRGHVSRSSPRDEERVKPLSPATSPAMSPSLPMGWESAKAPNGKTYYFHRASGKSQWHHPHVSKRTPSPAENRRRVEPVFVRRDMHNSTKKALDDSDKTVHAFAKDVFSPDEETVSMSSSLSVPRTPTENIAASFFTNTSSSVLKKRPIFKKGTTFKTIPHPKPEHLAKIRRRSSNNNIVHQFTKDLNARRGSSRNQARTREKPKAPEEDFSDFSKSELKTKYDRQLALEKALLRKAANLRREIARYKPVSDTPLLQTVYGDSTKLQATLESLRDEISAARRRRLRLNAAMKQAQSRSIDRDDDEMSKEKVAPTSDSSDPTESTTTTAQTDAGGYTSKETVITRPVLPEGWKVTVDPSTGRPYYYHVASGESSWNLPGADDNGDDNRSLPAGWARSRTKFGRKYYYNVGTGESSWEFPIGEIVEAEAGVEEEEQKLRRPDKHVHFVPSAEVLVKKRRHFKERRYSRSHGGSVTEDNELRKGSTRRNLRRFLQDELQVPVPPMDELKWSTVLTSAQVMADLHSEVCNVGNEIHELKRRIADINNEMAALDNQNSDAAFARMKERLRARNSKRSEKGEEDAKKTDELVKDSETAQDAKEGEDGEGNDDDGETSKEAERTEAIRSLEDILKNPPTLAKQVSCESEDVIDAFKAMDIENSGNLRTSAIRDYATRNGLVSDDSDQRFLKTLLDAVDLNGDGTVQFVEFGAIVRELKLRKEENDSGEHRRTSTIGVNEERANALSNHERLKTVNDVMDQVRTLHAEDKVESFVPVTDVGKNLSDVLGVISAGDDANMLEQVRLANDKMHKEVQRMYGMLGTNADTSDAPLLSHAPPGISSP